GCVRLQFTGLQLRVGLAEVQGGDAQRRLPGQRVTDGYTKGDQVVVLLVGVPRRQAVGPAYARDVAVEERERIDEFALFRVEDGDVLPDAEGVEPFAVLRGGQRHHLPRRGEGREHLVGFEVHHPDARLFGLVASYALLE